MTKDAASSGIMQSKGSLRLCVRLLSSYIPRVRASLLLQGGELAKLRTGVATSGKGFW